MNLKVFEEYLRKLEGGQTKRNHKHLPALLESVNAPIFP